MPPSDSRSNGSERDVLTSLPRTRPARRSAKRAGTARGATPPEAPAGAAASDTPARARAKAATKPKPAAAPAAGGRGRTASAKPAAARKRPARATAAKATATPRGDAAEPAVPPAGYATSSDSSSGRRGPDPFALVSTSFQAAGEIAQIGATLWSQAIRSAFGRFPKP